MSTPEILDIINEQDEVVGQAPKPQIYDESLPHRIVHIFILNAGGQILLQKRAATLSYCPEHWVTAACGHVTTGEEYVTAGARELQEEVGISTPLTLVATPIFITPNRPEFFKRLGVLVGYFEGPFAASERDVGEVRWFTPEEIDALVAKNELIHPEFAFLWREFRAPILNACTI